MTKKDYKSIAKVLSEVYANSNTSNQLDNLELIVNELIAMFKKDNPKFESSKFVYAIHKDIPEVLNIGI